MISLFGVAIEEWANEADIALGFKEVSVRLRTGCDRRVRVNRIAPRLYRRVLDRYVASEDQRDLIRPMLAKEFSDDAFLDSIRPGDLARLSNTVIVLHSSPNELNALVGWIQRAVATIRPKPANPPLIHA